MTKSTIFCHFNNKTIVMQICLAWIFIGLSFAQGKSAIQRCVCGWGVYGGGGSVEAKVRDWMVLDIPNI